jgi:hypothetical protein
MYRWPPMGGLASRATANTLSGTPPQYPTAQPPVSKPLPSWRHDWGHQPADRNKAASSR